MENRDEVVGWAMIPAYEPGGALGGLDFAPMSGGGVWTMNPNTEHPAEAWALLTFMNSAEQVTAGLGGQLRITNRDDVNAEILTEDPLMSFMADEVLQHDHFRPGLAEQRGVGRPPGGRRVSRHRHVAGGRSRRLPGCARGIVGADAVAVAGTEAPAVLEALLVPRRPRISRTAWAPTPLRRQAAEQAPASHERVSVSERSGYKRPVWLGNALDG